MCAYPVSPTVSEVAVGSGVDGVAEGELDLLVAGEVEGVCGACPHRHHIHAPDGPPQPLGAYDLPKGVHHIAVARSRLGLQALHSRLKGEREGEEKNRKRKRGVVIRNAPKPLFSADAEPYTLRIIRYLVKI